MGVFHIFEIVQMVPNRAKHLIYTYASEAQADPRNIQNGASREISQLLKVVN